MSTPGSRERATGLAILLISASAGINFTAGGLGVLLSFTGLLAGVSLVVVGVRMADDPAPIVPAVLAGVLVFLRRNFTVVGLVMASSAVTAVSGEAGQVLCFGMFALLLLGLSLINIW